MNPSLLSDDERATWHAFKTLGEGVIGAIERDLSNGAELSGSEFGILSRLADLGGGALRQQALLHSMGWNKSRLSHQLTRMQQRGLIVRTASQPRAVRIEITALGRQKVEAARPILAASVRGHLLDLLSESERASLLALSAKLTSNNSET